MGSKNPCDLELLLRKPTIGLYSARPISIETRTQVVVFQEQILKEQKQFTEECQKGKKENKRAYIGYATGMGTYLPTGGGSLHQKPRGGNP